MSFITPSFSAILNNTPIAPTLSSIKSTNGYGFLLKILFGVYAFKLLTSSRFNIKWYVLLLTTIIVCQYSVQDPMSYDIYTNHYKHSLSSSSIGYVNIDGLSSKHLAVSQLMQDNDIAIMIVAETKVQKFKSVPKSIVMHSDTVNYNYGMAAMLHPKYPNRDLNITSISPYHIKIQFDSFNIIGLYVPSSSLDKLQFFKDHIDAYVDENSVLVGDFNMGLNQPSTNLDHGILNHLIGKGLVYHDLEDTTYTFHRETTIGPQYTFIDHLLSPLNNCVSITSTRTIRMACTYHSAIVLEFCSSPIPLLPKNSKIKSYKVREDDYLLLFQSSMGANVSRRQLEFTLVNSFSFMPSNTTISLSTSSDLEKSYEILLDILLTSAECTFGKTKAHSFTIPPTSLKIGHELLTCYDDRSKAKASFQQKESIQIYKESIKQMDSTHFLKVIKYKKRRKFNPKSMLDFLQIDNYIDEWYTKWNNPLYSDIKFSYPHDIQDDFKFTIIDLENALSKLPKNKACGADNVDSEILLYAPDSYKQMMLDFINSILLVGALPSLLMLSDIIPLYKKCLGNLLEHHRPIALSSHFRKLIEVMLMDKIKQLLVTASNQYGYKSNTSISDAIYDIQQYLNSLQDANIPYKMVKLDGKGAFDNLSRMSIKLMITRLNCPSVLKRLFWCLAGQQQFRIRLGTFLSKTISSNMGVIQGGVISPLVYIWVVDDAFKDWDNSLGKIFFFADDLFLITTCTQIEIPVNEIERRLFTVGLTLQSSKTVIIDGTEHENYYFKYLGYYLNHKGCSYEIQMERNLSKARYSFGQQKYLGIFKNSTSHDKLLRSFGSFIFPILEFGLLIWNPKKVLCKKIDSFIRTCVRYLVGASKSTPIIDLEAMYGFTSFYTRCLDRHIAWHNHRCYKEGSTDVIHRKKVSMSFSVHPKLHPIQSEFPNISSLLLRQLPTRPAICTECGNQHSIANQFIKCQFKNFISSSQIQDPITSCSLLSVESYLNIHLDYLKSLSIADNLVIYTDGSFKPKYSSAAFLIITNNELTYEAFNVTSFDVTSSTRAELAAIALALNHEKVLNNSLPITIYSDSEAAISIWEDYWSNKNYRNIYAIDIIIQNKLNRNREINFIWVKGHANDPGNELVNMLCNCHFMHQIPTTIKYKRHNLTMKIIKLLNPLKSFSLFGIVEYGLTVCAKIKIDINRRIESIRRTLLDDM